jgi:hypothetical protein
LRRCEDAADFHFITAKPSDSPNDSVIENGKQALRYDAKRQQDSLSHARFSCLTDRFNLPDADYTTKWICFRLLTTCKELAKKLRARLDELRKETGDHYEYKPSGLPLQPHAEEAPM